MLNVDITDKLHKDISKLAKSNGMKFNTLFKRLVINSVKTNLPLFDISTLMIYDRDRKRINVDFVEEWLEIKKRAAELDIPARYILIAILEMELKKKHIVDSRTYK